MGASDPLIRRVHVPGAEPYEIGDEIWQRSLTDAIAAEAQTTTEDAGGVDTFARMGATIDSELRPLLIYE